MEKEEERSPLLEEDGVERIEKNEVTKDREAPPTIAAAPRSDGGWTPQGLPLGHITVMGEPVGRGEWGSGLFSCFGRNDEFCSSDLEVCE